MTKGKDEYAKALKGKRHFKDEVGAGLQPWTATIQRSSLLTHRDDGKHFVVRADQKLLAANSLDKQARFSETPGHENEHSTSSNHIWTRLLCARPKHASSCSSARWRLSRRQHRRRAKRPFQPHH